VRPSVDKVLEDLISDGSVARIIQKYGRFYREATAPTHVDLLPSNAIGLSSI
jgi:hypothetical protein